jgi:hypothetical protein
MIHSLTIEAAQEEIARLSAEAAEFHDEIDRLREEKNRRTRLIAALEQFIASQRPPNPLGTSRIG